MKTNFLALSKNDVVTHFIGQLKATHERAAVVLDEKRTYLGITSKRNLYRVSTDFTKLKVGKIIQQFPTLNKDDSLERIAELMYTANSRMLAVVDKDNKVRGVVLARDIINAIKNHPSLKGLKAKDVCTKKLITVNENASLGEAIHLMKKNNINRLIVVNEKGDLSGVLSFRDILKKHLSLPITRKETKFNRDELNKIELSSAPISGDIILDVKTSSPMESISIIINKLNEPKGSHVVLLEGTKPMGIVTPRDLIEVYLYSMQEKKEIQFVNLPKLDEIDEKIVSNVINETYDKIEKICQNKIALKIQFKDHNITGLRKKHTVNSQLTAPGISMNSKAVNWKMISAVQDSLSTLLRKVKEGKGRKKSRKSFRMLYKPRD